MKKSWRTTLGGLLVALGQGIESTKPIGDFSESVGHLLTLVGALVLGFTARDNVVSSEEAGAKPDIKSGGP